MQDHSHVLLIGGLNNIGFSIDTVQEFDANNLKIKLLGKLNFSRAQAGAIKL